jgi:hypothetical protein
VLNAVVIFAVSGHTSSAKPMKKVPSHRASWTRRMTAAWPAASRSRSSYFRTGPVISRNTAATTRSTSRVRWLPVLRGMMTVPTTLTAADSTSSAPAAAATSRTAIGAIKTISPQRVMDLQVAVTVIRQAGLARDGG